MRMFLLSSFAVIGVIALSAQAPSAPAKPPQETTPQPKPAPAPGATTPAPAPAPAQPRRAPAATTNRGGMAITVTDPRGLTLSGIQVSVSGATTRSGEKNPSGNLSVTGLMAGTYRLRFDGEKWISFEREVTLRSGQVLDVDVSLNPAPEPPPPPPPAPAPAPEPETQVGPKGQVQTISIPDWLEKEFVGREPRRETILSCSGNERTTMLQLNDPMPQRLYDAADVVYYVVAGEGTVTVDGKASRIPTSAFISVPRGTPHSFERRGNRPLMLLAVLGGEPCERAK
jgi:mannose-6-phosphate isomerase-like protein (cupin superfamily)